MNNFSEIHIKISANWRQKQAYSKNFEKKEKVGESTSPFSKCQHLQCSYNISRHSGSEGGIYIYICGADREQEIYPHEYAQLNFYK
jgi:hypothetical protein